MRKWPLLAPLLTVGFYVVFSLLIPTSIGWWIGSKVHHELLFLLIGLGIGTIIMFYGVYRMVRPFLEEAKREGREEEIHRPIRMFASLFPLKHKKDEEQK